ncbi:MAG: DUF1997 domain-containing protein [Synechococcus sp. BS307-5m-G38]|nr:DUF1997 domain-containing protein [Synechococcus sp. BS307-5m-G38]
MAFICLAEGSHSCSVAIPGGDQESLRRFLSRPKRPMAALLNRQRMKCKDHNHFFYQSRPFGILRFEIRPRVLFSARWSDHALMIAFQDCQIQGIGAVQDAFRFSCHAELHPCQDEVKAEATAAVLLNQDHPLAAIPVSLSKRAAQQALELVFARLERRCQGGLRRALVQWIDRQSAQGTSLSKPR